MPAEHFNDRRPKSIGGLRSHDSSRHNILNLHSGLLLVSKKYSKEFPFITLGIELRGFSFLNPRLYYNNAGVSEHTYLLYFFYLGLAEKSVTC